MTESSNLVGEEAVLPAARPPAPRPVTALEDLTAYPSAFDFDAAIALMIRAAGCSEPAGAVQMRAAVGLGYPGADILGVSRRGRHFEATIGLLGLTGPGGVLPRFYTELVNGERRRRSPALAAFLDMLAQRALAQFAQAPFKYRPALIATAARAGRDAAPDMASEEPKDGLRHVILALAGHAAPEMAGRHDESTGALLYYAGLFAMRPRSASRLQALLSDWLGAAVHIEQFAGHWGALAPEARSALPTSTNRGRFNRLGTDAAAGARHWDIQSRIEIRVGPLDLRGFRLMMPNGGLLPQLSALVTRYLDGGTGFTVRPVLAAASVPALRMSRATGTPRMGWDCWLPSAGPRARDAADVSFKCEKRS